VPRAGATVSLPEIDSSCLAQLARYKSAPEYMLVDSLPRNAMGTVQHFRLEEQIAGGAEAGGRERKANEDRRTGRWQWLVGGGR
jgi:acyl-CoA synthetase (AMP-forming)/AMP-acid ligase II